MLRATSPTMAHIRQEEERLRTSSQRHNPVTRDGVLSATIPRLRSDESWIELASQPSSSSLSSTATDEIVRTDLRIRQDSRQNFRARQRRRRMTELARSHLSLHTTSSDACSSQEEYDESESESESEEEQFVSSSTDDIAVHVPHLDLGPLPPSMDASIMEDDNGVDGDENTTALGVPEDDQVFTPQPNAFTHPPPSTTAMRESDSYFVRPEMRRGSATRHSFPSRTTQQHTPYNLISPSYQADHDAALRASLSTLLSCAAAARGLSKPSQTTAATARAGPSGGQPTVLRIVPESVVLRVDSGNVSPARSGKARSPSITSSELSSPEKAKRKASPSPVKGTKERASKKTKTLEDSVSPTLLTWVVSAGVVVVISAISFSAGYAMGKEAGLAEAGLVDVSEGTSCGKEAVRSLRRFRWGATGAASVRVS